MNKPAYYLIYLKYVVPVNTVLYCSLNNEKIVCNCFKFSTPVAFAVCQIPLIIAIVQ